VAVVAVKILPTELLVAVAVLVVFDAQLQQQVAADL
jgi:hypothetical protein